MKRRDMLRRDEGTRSVATPIRGGAEAWDAQVRGTGDTAVADLLTV